MYFKFLLIYSYLFVNYAECGLFSGSRSRLNFGTNIRPQYSARGFKSTGNFIPPQNNFGIRKPGVFQPINGYTGNIGFKTNSWSNARKPVFNPLPNVPPRQPVWNPAAIPKPVVQNDFPYAKQPAYNPNFKVANPAPLPRPQVQNVGPYGKQPPYNPNFNVPKPPILYPSAIPKPVVQNDYPYVKQPAYNPNFKVANPAPPPRPQVQNVGSYDKQPPSNPNFNAPKPPILYPSASAKPVQPAYNPNFKAANPSPPPMPGVQNVRPHANQPPYNPNFNMNLSKVFGVLHTIAKKIAKNHNSTNVTQTFENPILLSPEDSKDKFPILNLINTYSPKDSNSLNSGTSVEKSLISNKLPVIHRRNLETKPIYKGKPYILVTIVIVSVLTMAALIGGIMFCFRKKN